MLDFLKRTFLSNLIYGSSPDFISFSIVDAEIRRYPIASFFVNNSLWIINIILSIVLIKSIKTLTDVFALINIIKKA